MNILAGGNNYLHLSHVMRKPVLSYAKTKTQISFAVTAKLISAFVFATRIVQFLFYLNPKFKAPSHLLWLYGLVLCGTWSETPKTGFLTTRLICNRCQYKQLILISFSIQVILSTNLYVFIENCESIFVIK